MTDIPRKALVTGASSGLGAEFCRQLADECDEMILSARRPEPLQQLASELEQRGLKIRIVEADLSSTIGIARLVETIRQQGPLRYLVNNAGFTTIGPFMEQQPASQEAMVSLHINATMQLSLTALGGMKQQQRGDIINVSSLAALAPLGGIAVYCGTKAFINNFSIALQQEVQAMGIRIQCLCPGYIRTGFHRTAYFADFDPASIPDEFWMEAEDVVSESLAALGNPSAPLVYVPGEGNRAMAERAIKKLLDEGFGR